MGISDKLFVKRKREKVESVSERLVVKVDSSWIQASLKISPDSRRVAYVVIEKGKQFVVVDGEEGKQYDGIAEETPIFSPDSKRVAYTANVGKKCFVIVDGEEGKQYDVIVKDTLIFSPDDPDSIHYMAFLSSSVYTVEARIK